MIKVNKGNVKIKGNVVETMADLTCAIKAFSYNVANRTNSKEYARELVDKCVETAFMTEEEVEAETKKALANLLGRVAEDLGKEVEEIMEEEKNE